MGRSKKHHLPGAMTAKQFRRWMLDHTLSYTTAALVLGISRRQLGHYVAGTKPIPLTIWLATVGYTHMSRAAPNRLPKFTTHPLTPGHADRA